jgi:hypothetical protein
LPQRSQRHNDRCWGCTPSVNIGRCLFWGCRSLDAAAAALPRLKDPVATGYSRRFLSQVGVLNPPLRFGQQRGIKSLAASPYRLRNRSSIVQNAGRKTLVGSQSAPARATSRKSRKIETRASRAATFVKRCLERVHRLGKEEGGRKAGRYMHCTLFEDFQSLSCILNISARKLILSGTRAGKAANGKPVESSTPLEKFQ